MSAIMEKLQDIAKALESLNTEKVTATPQGVVGKDGAAAQAEIDAGAVRMKQLELRSKFKALPTNQIMEMLQVQAGAEAGKQADSGLLNMVAASDPGIRKLLDTTGGAALIRQDLEPLLYALFVKRFPFWDRIQKEPANGLVHAYNQITSYGDAAFITETGTVTDDTSAYVQKTSNIGVIATRRGVSLKQQFAVSQGGAPYNSLAQELNGGVIAISSKLQRTIFQGNATTAAKTAADEEGAYDANSFTGLRFLLGTPNAAANPVVVEKGGSSYIAAFNTAIAGVLDNGGLPTAIAMRPGRYSDWVNELLATIRQNPGAAGAQGLDFGSVLTAAGPLPIVTVPGNGIGTYTLVSPSREDIYVLDEDTLSAPWLGSDSITTLEIPVGVNGALTRLYVMFAMFGLAVKAPLFNAKVRI
ncbi:MAG: hypothetical protein C0498_01385 [Anaerolinea sp.]|nr:hypothetical protein [Anaerolinea sp.]